MIYIIIILVVLITLYLHSTQGFYIEPNTVTGGVMMDSGMGYNAPLELEGPGDAAWSGY